MASEELAAMLADSAAEVPESMFFTSPVGEAGPGPLPSRPWICAALAFRGDPPGTPIATARRMAASFLGREAGTLLDREAGEVVYELANMLCGSVLSRLEKETRFELRAPALEPPESACADCPTVTRRFELDEGPLEVWLEVSA